MKKLLVFGFLAAISYAGLAQTKMIDRSAKITFFSKAPLEDIEAVNSQVTAVLAVETGDIAFKVAMKSFDFEKAAMKEHFNRDYVHSEKFPNASFEGKISNLSDVKLSKDGTYDATVEGKMTIHGVTKEVSQSGKITVEGGSVSINAKFPLVLSDYDVKVPSDFTKKISNTVEITVAAKLEVFKR